MSKLLIVLVMFGTAGCSDKAIYETFRLNQRNNCVNELPATYFKCIERTNKPYDEYERERKEINLGQSSMEQSTLTQTNPKSVEIS